MKLITILAALLLNHSIHAKDWQSDVADWKKQRVERLTQPHGWLSLIGMEWFTKGQNSIGSAKDNSIVLPHGPEYLGSFWYTDKGITFVPQDGVSIHANDMPVKEKITVKMDSSGEPTIFTADSFQFYVIERGKPALRIKDSQAMTLKEFSGIDYFPVNEKFRVKAEFIPYTPEKKIDIINVLGLLSESSALGRLNFNLDGKNLNLDVLDAGDEYYIIFADKTSGRTSYGPGRFLYVPKPEVGNEVLIDFNTAYNPPCAFSDYSTCPLPPPQNRIPVYIEAGEKKYKK